MTDPHVRDATSLERASAETYFEVTTFLNEEAESLDRGDARNWLSFLAKDIRYRMPVRVTMAHSLAGSLSADMDHFQEDWYSLTKRVERLETDHAWTEDPPSRTRRFVTNVQVWHDGPDALLAKSYLLLFRSRGDTRAPEWLVAARTDRLRRVPEQRLEIVDRLVVVDEAVLRTQNLAVFL